MLCGCAGNAPPPGVGPRKLIAQTYDSGFQHAHDTYNGMGTGSDGKIYYVLSSELHDMRRRECLCSIRRPKQIKLVGDLTEASGEKGMNAVAQGKSHVKFVESNGKLYFATHVGYYSIIDGMEKMGTPPKGFMPYPGGHLLAYDMASGNFESLASRRAARASSP